MHCSSSPGFISSTLARAQLCNTVRWNGGTIFSALHKAGPATLLAFCTVDIRYHSRV